jgi:hypothetical protein
MRFSFDDIFFCAVCLSLLLEKCSGDRGGGGGGSVTREAAHNLVLIYKQLDSHNLALEIMLKYLVV